MTEDGHPRVAPATATLGASLVDQGTRFAVASGVATSVEVCLFDEHGREERVAMTEGDAGRWQVVVAGVTSGQRYGLRVHGPYEPERGRRCDPRKLLLDPYSRAFCDRALEPRSALSAGSGVDTAAIVPHCVVVDDRFDWASEGARPRYRWDETVVYEVHVRGATMRHPGVPESLRGTYAGVGHAAFVSHLVDLGVTAVELLPVHELVDEGFLVDAGLTNYWGYNSVGYFAPTARYAATTAPGAQVDEFKAMVAALHRAGLEVILDVVYNHTAEGDVEGPTLCFRGLDAEAYYRHDEAYHLVDTTGCGNSINAASETAVGLVVDSLRYWVSQCHVDGFRFDLAPTLARPAGPFDPLAPLLARCATDPVVAQAKLICEPWDVGAEDSYALGRFPAPYREWNGRFRDTVRDFWRGEDDVLASLATCLAGSSDLFGPERGWTSSVNYVTSHDGFTLRDLVSFEAKHNEANGEDNTDGTNDNRSWNCGVEGDTDDPEVVALRARQVRAMLTTLLTSRGVPMLLGGDEMGRTQGGNNNAYCQDNETSWLDWDGADAELLEFTTTLLALRRAHPALRGIDEDPGRAPITWSRPDGAAMADEDWDDVGSRCVALRTTSSTEVLVVCVNGHSEPVGFELPGPAISPYVEALSSDDPARHGRAHDAGTVVEVPGRSVLVLVASEAVARSEG